jgi:hypothetical protein
LLGKSLLKHFFEGKIEGRIEVTGRRGRRLRSYSMTLKDRIVEISRGRNR